MTDNRDQNPGGRRASRGSDVLPDFCSAETLLRVLVLAVLLAVVVLLLRGGHGDPVLALAPLILFIVWVALSSLAVLCLFQRALRTWPLPVQVILPALVPVLNTAAVHMGAESLGLADAAQRWTAIAVAAVLSLIAIHYFYLVAAWKRESQAVAEAREQAMRARVRPHFLFNSMNTIAGLCRSDPVKAEQITLDLADLFRATFAAGPAHSLARELELVRAYLDIEQTRFGERLRVEWDVPETPAFSMQIPTLLLQPLVENAIQHGIAPSLRGGAVQIRVSLDKHTVGIEIANTLGERTGAGTRTAGAEVHARLRQFFGPGATCTAERDKDRYKVTLRLPLDESPAQDTPCH